MFSWKRNIVAIFIALKMVTLVVGQTNPPPRQTPNVITTSPTTQSIPTGLAKGVNPLGSYGGSNFDKINLFNGNVSMSFPLASLTSRGGMSAGVVLSYNSKLWYVDKVETDVTARIINEPSTVSVAYIPSYSEPDPEISSLGAGWTIHAGSLRVVSTAIYNKANRTCVFPGPGVQPVKPEKTISIVTFTAPDGTTYDFRDRIYDGEPRFLVNCEGVSRGKRFESKDGTSATFVSDTEIKDGFFSLSNTNISGYVYLRDGTRFRIEQGRVVKQRDNNGNIIEYTYEGNRLKRVTDNMGRTIEVRYDVSARILATVTVKGILGQARVTTIRGGRLENHLAANESRKNIDELFPVEAVQMSVPGFSFNPRTVSEVILPDSDPSGSPEGHEWEFKYNSYGEVVRVKTPARGVVEFDMGPNIGLNNGGYDTILNQIFRRVVARRTYPSDNGPIEGKVTYSDPTDPAKIDNGDVTVEQTEVDPNDGERILSKSTHKFSGHPKRGLDRMGGTPARTGYRPWLEGKELETEQFNFDGTTAMRRTITKYKQQSGVAWVAGADENTLAQPENNPRVTKITNSLLDGTTPKTSKTDYEYDQFNNVTRETLTGYNNEIIRQVERTYISTLNGIDYTSLNAQEGQDLETVLDTHLRSLIDTETIKNASGDAENTAKYEYDQYSGTNNAALVPRTLTVNTHAQRYQSPSRVQRGNVTSVTTGVGKPEASILYSHYDVLGNVVEVLGPNPEQRTETIYELTSQFTFPEQTKQYVSGGVSGNRVLTSSRSFDFDTGAVLSSTGFNGDITSFQYNDQLDRLTLEIRPLDNAQGGFGRTSYTYSAPGAYPNTVEVKTSLDNGRVLTSKSEFDGFLRTTRQRRTDPNGEVKSETFYDALGRVEKITNPFRQTSSTTDGYTISQYDALSRVFRIQTFDNANNLTGTVNTLYDTNLVTVTDQAGKQRKSETDAAGRLVKVYEPSSEFNILDQITSYRYDARSNLEQVNQGVQVRTFAYDALSRLISATSPESGSEFSSGTTTYQYDDASNLTRKVDARNITTIYTYDSLNRLATKNYSNSTPDVSYFYDVIPSSLPSGVFLPPSFSFQNTLGRKTAMASASTSSQSATAWFHTYDVGGRITKNSQLLSGRHHTSENDYNLASLPTQHTYPSGKVIAHNYNIAGQLSQVTRNGFLLSKEIEYTASGSLSVQSLGNSLEHSIKYNSRLQPTSISLGTSVSTSASDKMRIDYVYGTLTDNGIVQENRNNGNIARITLTSGSSDPITQDFKYDELNRLSKASEYANNQFCEFDNRVLFKSDNVRETDTHFEILSSPGDNSGAGATIAFELNLGDRQAGNGQHLYLVAERLSVVIPPNTSRVSAGLDLDTNGVNFEIDNQDFNTRRSASFEYFAASADNPNALAIDALASDFGLTNIFRPTLILDSASGVVRFNLSLGIFYNTSQTELPEVIARIPKKLKFICTTKVPAKVFGNATLPCSSARDVTFNYVDPNDPSEGVIKIFGSLSNVIVRGEFIGSGQGQVAKVENVDCETFRLYATNSSGVDSLYSFQPTPPSANSLISKVEKDSATNLDIATNLSWQQEYVYDRYGNRKEVIGLNEQQLTISPNKNRITDAGYLYDNAGNLIADPSGKSYEYDGENRLIKVLSGFSVIATYEYDGSGLRVRKTANGVITHFIYNNSQLIAEYEGENLPPLSSPTKEYYYGASGLVATSDNNDPLHFHTPDHLGSPRVITNFDGKVIVRRDFLPFGESLDPSLGGRAFTSGYISNDSLRQKFTGYERDDESGLDFAQARHFNGALGRFMQVDEFSGGPYEFYNFAAAASSNPTFYSDTATPQSLNKYQYCFNNPLKYVDPNGHQGGLKDRVVAGLEAAGDFLGGAIKGFAASVSFGAVGTPSKTDSALNRLGQGYGTFAAGAIGTDIAISGGAAEIVSLGTATPIAVPAVVGGAAMTAGAAANLGRLASTPFRNQANNEGGGSGDKTKNPVNAAEQTKTSDLEPTLTKSKTKMNELAKDIKENGVKESIKYVEYNGKKYVVDGHHRLEGAKRANQATVPTQKVDLPYKGYKTTDDLFR